MKTIPLTNGGEAIVDDDMYVQLAKFKWRRDACGYARRQTSKGGLARAIFVHQVVLPGHSVVDHINQNKLDNRRENLRPSTKQKNAVNSKRRVTNTSGYKNVTQFKPYNRWRAHVTRNYKHIHLGLFDQKEQAAQAVRDYLKQEGICYLEPTDITP